eukprot:6082131-Lingulodinium_polyedra.AAC.1
MAKTRLAPPAPRFQRLTQQKHTQMPPSTWPRVVRAASSATRRLKSQERRGMVLQRTQAQR